MLPLIILILLTVLFYIHVTKILYTRKSFRKAAADFDKAKKDCDNLITQNSKLKTDNSLLNNSAEETIALYDITKEICKSLDENKIFTTFCELINRYVQIRDCKFVKSEQELKQFKDHTILPLTIDKQVNAYLAADIIRPQDKDKFYILGQQFILGIKRAFLYQNVQELAIMDSLTQTFSRRYLMERFNEEIERSSKIKYHFSLLMLDIDFFKEYNDRYGHLVGDAVLKEIAQTIKENIRQIDLVGRYGGEEFSIILSETDKDGARFAAERIRQAIENKEIRVYDENLKATISIGIATFPQDAPNAQQLIDRADRALYQAKHAGRNRVSVYGVMK